MDEPTEVFAGSIVANVFTLGAEVEKLRRENSDLRFLLGKCAGWAGADLSELYERYGVPGER